MGTVLAGQEGEARGSERRRDRCWVFVSWDLGQRTEQQGGVEATKSCHSREQGCPRGLGWSRGRLEQQRDASPQRVIWTVG